MRYLLTLVIFLAFPTWAYGSPTLKERFYHHLTERFAPVLVQAIGHKPLYDRITSFDFDRDKDTSNNVPNAPASSLPASVYGGVIAETEDSFYIFYGVYHAADYDTPLREFFFASARHDNDFEGAIVLVSKGSGAVRAVETWFHNRFLQFTPIPLMMGSQTLDGKIHLEDRTHPILFVQNLGHGVRALQKIDESLLESPFQIYRHGREATDLQETETAFATYQLIGLDDFARFAKGPFGQSVFDQPQDFGIGRFPLGRYFSGRFAGDSSWARPKPPWSWCDRFDTLRPGAWFFHPAYVFNKHFRLGLSEHYRYNFSRDKLLKADQAALENWVQVQVPAYFNDIPHGILARPFRQLRKVLYGIAEYLFYVLG